MKKTIVVLSDHPMSPSGVGTQTKYMIEAMIKTGKYRFVCLGGAIKHKDYRPIKTKEYGDDFIVYPVDGYGDADKVRSLLRSEKPAALWFMTDPRFWGWLWEMEDEIRPLVPMIYYHVWDNYPAPMYNKPHYMSNDAVVSISKVTNNIVKEVAPEVDLFHVPHTADLDVFCPMSSEKKETFRKQYFGEASNKFVFFWNNRNARRKQSGTLIFWFKKFLDKVGRDKATLIMHTDLKDVHGQDLLAIVDRLKLVDGEVKFSTEHVTPQQLAMVYNIADCTVNIADAEGFGLSTLESLACGTPIIVNMTGGLQEQVTDGEEWFGIGIEPSSKAVIGSQDIPYIYEDRINEDDFVDALVEMYEKSPEEREKLGLKGREYVEKNYSFDAYARNWENVFEAILEKNGAWETREGYKRYVCKEVIHED